MEKYKVIINPTAEKDFSRHKKAGNAATIKKILTILNELKEHPYTGEGQPEELKFDLKGLWSRRINKKDRLIYLRSKRRDCNRVRYCCNGTLFR